MPLNELSLTNFTESIAGLMEYNIKLQQTNESEYKKILKILTKAISGELTDRQRECLTMKYYQKLTVTEIAGKIGVGKSTVSRHIKKAKLRLERVLNYYITLS